MAEFLIWSDRAMREYEKLQAYLLREWGTVVADRVDDEIERTIFRIKNHPEQFPVFIKAKKIRRCVASPQTSIFFKADKDAIEIVSVFDNRQNPKKRKL
jgi:plasmid stabilization system protein ParE